ncbi:MAG: glycoside hydrolase family 43 protein [Candidatus Merdivicinus sp.]|jgi:xylan 1,4-beta-xylosidase
MKVQNPILRGFKPDPSIVRVGSSYYIAVSTFEWWPGVLIYRSEDLVNWTLASRPLNRLSQMDLAGVPDSCGIWAPCLSYSDGKFYLIYTIVRNTAGIWKDVHNYLVTADEVEGEWSDPVYLNSSGFDPSLFHDGDKKWLVNVLWEHRTGRHRFGGIVLQEYSPEQKKLVGEIYNIFGGSEIHVTEGPHLYKKDGWYYLLTAEGGTGENHAATVARSRNLTGPYEIHPENPILTSKANPAPALKKAGHASFVETPEGDWYLVHLCARPAGNTGMCPLGRETALQKMVWKNDWPYVVDGPLPSEEVKLWKESSVKLPDQEESVSFREGKLPDSFQSLRLPIGDAMSFTDRPGYLRLYGQESLSSLFRQSLLARRWEHFTFEAETTLDFHPVSHQQMAGLVCYYNSRNFYYLNVSGDCGGGKYLYIISCINGTFSEPTEGTYLPLPEDAEVRLGVTVKEGHALQFRYAVKGEEWKNIGPVLDGSLLSDEHVEGAAYTGAFVGVCCQDLSGRRQPADFADFCYRPME